MVRAVVSKPTVESIAAKLDRLERVIAHAFLCSKGVMARYGWSDRTFYRRKKEKTFPHPHTFPWSRLEVGRPESGGTGRIPTQSGGRIAGTDTLSVRPVLSVTDGREGGLSVEWSVFCVRPLGVNLSGLGLKKGVCDRTVPA